LEHFTIDNQTFNDLDIFTAKDGSKSIFDLFKHTRTVRARKRLLEIMQSPSNNLEDITLRRDAIKYFHDYRLSLEIKNEEIDLIEFYLKSTFKPFKNNPLDALADYVMRESSNDFYVIKTGQRYLIQLTKYILDFIKNQKIHQTPKYLTRIFEQINEIIGDGVLLQATKLDEKQLSFWNVCRLDRALRGTEKENVKILLQLIYELDVFENIALVGSANGFSYSVFREESQLKLTINGLFHPSISNAIKNNVHIDHKQNIIFLTGSNMSGKSSLLKSLGLVIYLAHLGFPVPADAMESTVFNGLITTINLPDNINQGLSHYFTEVKRVKEVAESLLKNNRVFVIFDELFRGTNVKDAFDGSSLIMSELSTINNSVFIISSHIIELAAVLREFSNISFRYLDTYFQDQKPVFTFRLTEGIAKEALGMYIVRNEGIVELLRQAAKNTTH
jgi:DNA mismatch repair protein MutS